MEVCLWGESYWNVPSLQDSNPGGISEINATVEVLKEARMVVPITYPFNSPIWPVQKSDRF